MHFFTCLMKLVLGLAFFHRQKASWKHGGQGWAMAVGSCSVSLISCLFGWVSFLQSVLWPPEWNRSLPRDALCSFSLYSWEWDPLFACGVSGVLPCEPGIFCPAHYSSAASRMAEACGLMTLGGRLMGAGVAWVDNEWRPVCRGEGRGPETQGSGGTEEGVIKQ